MDNNKNENAVARQAFESVSITVALISSAGRLCAASPSDDPPESSTVSISEMTGTQLF